MGLKKFERWQRRRTKPSPLGIAGRGSYRIIKWVVVVWVVVNRQRKKKKKSLEIVLAENFWQQFLATISGGNCSVTVKKYRTCTVKNNRG